MRRNIIDNDVYVLLMRAAMGEKLDRQESAVLKEYLNNTCKK